MRESARRALAFSAGASGAGMALGRDIAVSFSRLGRASWVGIGAACLSIMLAVRAIGAMGRDTGAGDLPELAAALLGKAWGHAASAAFGLLWASAAGMMLSACGEAAALTLPIPGARALGEDIALCLGLLMARKELSAVWKPGALLFMLLMACFLAAGRGQGSRTGCPAVGALLCLPSGLLYGLITVCLAGCAMMGTEECRDAATGCGALMAALLFSGNAALLRAGEPTMNLAAPMAALLSRLGETGYVLCAGSLFLAALCSLLVMLCCLKRAFTRAPINRPAVALVLPCAAAWAFSRLPGAILRAAYPACAWLCVLLLIGCMIRYGLSGSARRQE